MPPTASPPAAGIVLAGGRSSRMGRPKAALDWHGQPLVLRLAGILVRCELRPVVVVRAPGMLLPPLPSCIELAEDEQEGAGPLEGLATGLAAIESRAAAAFVTGTDAPFLQPAFVDGALAALAPQLEVVAARSADRPHPLPAVYRSSLHGRARSLLAAGSASLTGLLEASRTRYLEGRELTALDPELASLENLNDPGDYERALARRLPGVEVRGRSRAPLIVAAATLGAAFEAAGHRPAGGRVGLNGRSFPAEPWIPLADGDRVDLDLPAEDAGG